LFFIARYGGPETGVPQGSVLGPLLYTIYVNDLCNVIARCNIVQYADDTCLMIKSKSSSHEFRAKVEDAANNILRWFHVNKLMVNMKKCKFIVFGRKRTEIPSIELLRQTVTRSDSVTYLGLRIDSRLDWHVHINYVVSRIGQFRYMLNRLRCAFDPVLRAYLAKTLILPVIDLYDFIYCSTWSVNLHHLDVAYNNLMRTITGVRRSEHVAITDLCRRCGFELLQVRRDRALTTFMRKVVSGNVCSTLNLQCVRGNSLHDTRSRDRYVIPKSTTSVGSRRILVRGLKMLNRCSTT
jgi:hypothetical protein